ncbi:MAG TPA: hypothetical protein VGN76_07055 [Gemmatimonadales bacterium]|jgi:hypothetical protein|nr:hypothetical protein [Gemmatimonadales bacterium]
MKVKHLLLSSVLAIPALLLPLASCDDSKTPLEPTVSDEAPDLSVASTRNNHDPRSQAGPQVKVFDGTTDTKNGDAGLCGPGGTPPACVYGGTSKRNRTKDGAEINTMVNQTDGAYGGLYPSVNKIKGKLLTQVHELDFSYAGGPHVGGVPRLSIPIDCVQDAEYVGAVAATCATDGNYDHFAFIDAPGCNDGDEFVGTVEADDNPNCNVNYNSVDYPNWNAFMTAHPGARIARDQITFIIVDRAGGDNNFGAHYIIWKVDIR